MKLKSSNDQILPAQQAVSLTELLVVGVAKFG
jgi:hypothetical protein